LEPVLSTADPNLQVLACDLDMRVAIAEKNWKRAEGSLQNGLAILEEFEIPVAGWRVHATAYDLYRQKRKHSAELHRARAEVYIRSLADSFAPDEPLRSTFLAAAPVSRILNKAVSAKAPERSSTSASR